MLGQPAAGPRPERTGRGRARCPARRASRPGPRWPGSRWPTGRRGTRRRRRRTRRTRSPPPPGRPARWPAPGRRCRAGAARPGSAVRRPRPPSAARPAPGPAVATPMVSPRLTVRAAEGEQPGRHRRGLLRVHPALPRVTEGHRHVAADPQTAAPGVRRSPAPAMAMAPSSVVLRFRCGEGLGGRHEHRHLVGPGRHGPVEAPAVGGEHRVADARAGAAARPSPPRRRPAGAPRSGRRSWWPRWRSDRRRRAGRSAPA